MELVFFIIALIVIAFMFFLIKNDSARAFINRIMPPSGRIPQKPPLLDEYGTGHEPTTGLTPGNGLQEPRFARQVFGYDREQVDGAFCDLIAERAQLVRRLEELKADNGITGEDEH